MKTGSLYRKINHAPAAGRRYTEVEDANYLFNEYGISVNKVGSIIRKVTPNAPKEELNKVGNLDEITGGGGGNKPIISKEDVIMTLNTPLLEVLLLYYYIILLYYFFSLLFTLLFFLFTLSLSFLSFSLSSILSLLFFFILFICVIEKNNIT